MDRSKFDSTSPKLTSHIPKFRRWIKLRLVKRLKVKPNQFHIKGSDGNYCLFCFCFSCLSIKSLKMKMWTQRGSHGALGIPLSNWTDSQTAWETVIPPPLPPPLSVVTEGVTSDGSCWLLEKLKSPELGLSHSQMMAVCKCPLVAEQGIPPSGGSLTWEQARRK